MEPQGVTVRECFEKKYVILALLFMAKTIPQIFFMMALPVILRIEGYSLKTIGLLQLAGVPFLLKFLWAPLLDRKGLEKDHYKLWTLFTGAGCGLLIVCMAFLNVGDQFLLLAGFVVATSFVGSTQDIAVSALYIKLLDYEQRGLGSSSKIFAVNLATIIGSGLFLLLYNHLGWRSTMLSMAVSILLPLSLLGVLRENKQEQVDGTVRQGGISWSSLLTFFRGPGMLRWFSLIVLNSIGIFAVFFIVKPFLVDYGVDPDTIAFLVGFYGMGIAVLVAMATGLPVIQKYMLDRKKMYLGCVVFNAVAVALFIPLSVLNNVFFFFYIAMALLNTATTVSSVTSGVLVMDFSRKGFESIDYSLQMTGIHIGGMVMAAFSGMIVEQTGYPLFFVLLTLVGIGLVVLTFFLFRGEWIPKAEYAAVHQEAPD